MDKISLALIDYLSAFKEFEKGGISKAGLDKAGEKYRLVSEAYKWRSE